MKKKWLWLLVLPVFIGMAILWAREASWRKQENQFRLATQEWLRNGAASTRVYPNSLRPREEDVRIVFFDESADSLLHIDQMELIASPSTRPRNEPLIFISMSSGSSSSGEPWGFYLAESEDRGWIEIPEPDVDTWKNYELASETCHALKGRIRELQKMGGN